MVSTPTATEISCHSMHLIRHFRVNGEEAGGLTLHGDVRRMLCSMYVLALSGWLALSG